MGQIGVVLGSNATGSHAGPLRDAVTAHGIEVLERHGRESYVPPHLVDHEANLRSLLEAGCDRLLAICSVGSLRGEIGVGTLVCPDDFIALHLGLSAFDDARGHVAPGLDPQWRRLVLEAGAGVAPVRDGGVYWQTIGPRFETPAEIRMMSAHADLVGMTMASECVVAGELGISYAALCVVDNLANGLGPAPLSVDDLERDRAANAEQLDRVLGGLLAVLAG